MEDIDRLEELLTKCIGLWTTQQKLIEKTTWILTEHLEFFDEEWNKTIKQCKSIFKNKK